jgi:hypothetical protein
MDYSCAWGTGGSAHVITQTVIVLEGAVASAPDLLIYPKSMFEKLAEAVGLEANAVKLPGADKFNKKYGLYTDQRIKANACCTPELTGLCVKEDNVVLETSGGDLLVYWSETDIKPGELEEYLTTASKIVGAMEAP